ncbi:MAG TPA: hypothetical protein VES68_03570 [Candidatus Sulfotelmatobacter sp.]|nr:hypothetical protein [Candidatus Sulfotelmatobacter sp.]
MMLFHGTDNPNLKLKPVKDGIGYHPGAGPVEFLGPSFSDNKLVAQTYGKYLLSKDFKFKKVKQFKSLNVLKNDILKTFALTSGINLGEQYKDIADSYKIKLTSDGFDAITFPEGVKTDTNHLIANTYIPLI